MKRLALFLGIFLAMATPGYAQPSNSKFRCVVIHRAGPQWDFNVGMMAQQYIYNQSNPDDATTHVGHFVTSGMVSVGGPMANAPEKIGDIVGMMISPAGVISDNTNCMQLGLDDPAVKAGILSFEAQLWSPKMGNL